MSNDPMEIILEREELICVMHALRVRYLAGLELSEFDLPEKQFKKLVETGKQKLIAHSLMDADSQKIAPGLVDVVSTLVFRELAIILVRGIRGKGKQLFIFNFHQEKLVEHTMPVEGQHRLKVIEAYEDFFNRIDQIASLTPVTRKGRPEYTIGQASFEQAQSLAPSDAQKALKLLLDEEIPKDMASSVVSALSKPLLTLSFACLTIKNNKVADASSFAIFAIDDAAWGIWPGEMDSRNPRLLLFPTGSNDIRSALIDWLNLRDNPDIMRRLG